MSDMTQYEVLLDIMARLRGPDGCPWDREQTHESLQPYLLEEVYETLEAIDRNDCPELCKELGDVLLQIVFHAQIASEAGHFCMEDVCQSLVDKLVHRHPHVFGDAQVDGSSQVLANRERLKQQEKKAAAQRASILEGLPAGMPALLRAQRVQSRAARVGFDWPSLDGPLDKVEEEFDELRAEWQQGHTERAEEELGDLLFALVNVARFLQADPENALRRAVDKFERRFRTLETVFHEAGRDIGQATLEEMDAAWDEIKSHE